MELGTKNRQIANAYYNLGLEKACQRDLSGAVRALKKSLQFDKFQIDARNLLGLIYNELGEVGAALTQWIVSQNLQTEYNLAAEYLSRIQAAPAYLDAADQALKKYNQALEYAQNENEDLAVLILIRVAADVPNFVKAQELLALLCIYKEEYSRARKCLYQALKIDSYNPRALRYLSLVKHNADKADTEHRKIKNALSHRQMQDDDIIIPPTYKENTGWQSIFNILAGLALGAAVIFFLVLPASREQLNSRYNQQMRQQLEAMNQKSIEIDELNRRLEEAQEKQSEAEASLSVFLADSDAVLSQYQNFARLLQAYRDEDMQTAVLLYTELDFSVLNDGQLNEIAASVQEDMKANGPKTLEQMGDKAITQGNLEKAINYFQKSLQIKPTNADVIFKLADAYLAQGDTDTANQYYGDIIMNYPNSEYVESAKEKRGY